jgi:phosphoserine phosphatase
LSHIIATLVAPQGLTPGDISAACDAVGGMAGPVRDGVAVQIVCDDVDAKAALEAAVPGADVIVRPVGAPLPRLLIADMDSTMITCECIDELADYAGIKPEIAAITERAMAGELDFAAALAERVALLAGLSEKVIEQCLAERVRPTPGAATLVQTLRARGTRTVLVSGGFTRFAEPVAAMIGFDRAVANVLEIQGGVLIGRVLPPIVDSAVKRATLEAECAEFQISPADVLAIGDGANDVPMLRTAGLGVAYRGHAAAVAAAEASIRHGDLTTLLYAMGIAKADWVA